MRRAAILMMTCLVATACGGNGGGPATTTAGPGQGTTTLPTAPDGTQPFEERVGMATVVFDGQTLQFDSREGTKTDWNFSIRAGCAAGNLGWVGISAAGVDASGNHLAHEAWIDIKLPTPEYDSSELSFRLHTEDGLLAIDRDDPGDWDLDYDATGATASGEVNLVDSSTKEPVGTATFEMSCR